MQTRRLIYLCILNSLILGSHLSFGQEGEREFPEKNLNETFICKNRIQSQNPIFDLNLALQAFKDTDFYKAALIEKEKEVNSVVEEGDAYNDFLDTDPLWKILTSHPEQKQTYKLKGWKSTETDKVCKAFDIAAKGLDPEAEGNEAINKHISNCTTASFLALIKLVRATYKDKSDWDSKLKKNFTCPPKWPLAYTMYGGINGFERFMLGYKDKNNTVIYPGFLKKMGIESEPENHYKLMLNPFNNKKLSFAKKYDPVLINRKNGTGHSVLFHSFIDKNGVDIAESNEPATKLCYWSSNGKYKGASNRCESISTFYRLDVIKI